MIDEFTVVGLAAVPMTVFLLLIWSVDMWTKLMSWFHDSETIFLARLQMVLGVAWSVAVATDWSPFIGPRWMPLYMFAMGVVTELARRARADDL